MKYLMAIILAVTGWFSLTVFSNSNDISTLKVFDPSLVATNARDISALKAFDSSCQDAHKEIRINVRETRGDVKRILELMIKK